MTSKPQRRWQFGLRDLFYVTVIAAVALAAYKNHLTQRGEIERLRAAEAEATNRANQAESMMRDVSLHVRGSYYDKGTLIKENDALRAENERLRALLDAVP